MAARLKQVAREQKAAIRGATMEVLRVVVKEAEFGFARSGALARNVWGVTSKRGVWRSNFWRGRKVTQSSLGLSRRTKARDRTGAKWERWRRDYKASRNAAARVSRRAGLPARGSNDATHQ